jgi:hypothetical protein
MHRSYENADLFNEKYAHNVKRQKLHEAREAELFDFFANTCPVKSGSRNVTYRQYINDDALYESYRQGVEQPVCFNTFYKRKVWMRIKRKGKYFGMFDCKLCYRLYVIPSLLNKPSLTAADRQKLIIDLAKCKAHQELRFFQRRQFETMRHALRPKQLFVLMDFTSTTLSDKPGPGTGVEDCIVSMEYLNDAGQRVRRHLDFLCADIDTKKHDYHFVLQVWVKLFVEERLNARFDRIDIWTDGGPHHFKTRYCQFMWHALSSLRFDRKPICHHFFASYHGHSIADGHAATIKRALNTRYNISQFERMTRNPNATWGPTKVKEFAEILNKTCQGTEASVFEVLDRSEENKPEVTGIPAIKSMHCFLYQDNTCRCWPRSNIAGSTAFSFKYEQAQPSAAAPPNNRFRIKLS